MRVIGAIEILPSMTRSKPITIAVNIGELPITKRDAFAGKRKYSVILLQREARLGDEVFLSAMKTATLPKAKASTKGEALILHREQGKRDQGHLSRTFLSSV